MLRMIALKQIAPGSEEDPRRLVADISVHTEKENGEERHVFCLVFESEC